MEDGGPKHTNPKRQRGEEEIELQRHVAPKSRVGLVDAYTFCRSFMSGSRYFTVLRIEASST